MMFPSRASSRRPETGLRERVGAARYNWTGNGRIRRTSSLSCIIRPTMGPVRPVVPGDSNLRLLVPPEQHPRRDSGRQLKLGLGWISGWGGPCRGLGYFGGCQLLHRVDGVCEAARDGFQCFWAPLDQFCGAGRDGPSGSGARVVF